MISMPDQHQVDERLCFLIMPFDTSLCGLPVHSCRPDLTVDTNHNPNVFYEVGFSRALEKNVILLLQEGSEAPFDIRDIRYMRYSKSTLPDLAAHLKEYVRGCMCTLPTSWRTTPTSGRPDVRISHLDYPLAAIAGEVIRITAHAKNFGAAAEQAYVSLSFPSEPADLRILESKIKTRLGKKGESWKASEVVLRYSIAEMFVYGTAGKTGWKENISHSMTVEFIAPRPGLFQFYVSARSRNAGQEFSQDPTGAALRDQRDEPVYCGVIEVQDRTASP